MIIFSDFGRSLLTHPSVDYVVKLHVIILATCFLRGQNKVIKKLWKSCRTDFIIVWNPGEVEGVLVDDAEDEVGVAGGPTISVGVQGFLILSQIKPNSRLAVKEIPEIWKKIILQNRSQNKAQTFSYYFQLILNTLEFLL